MHVLFIGNSYTLYNDVPAQVKRLVTEVGVDIDATMAAEGGATLEVHEQREATQQALRDSPWTHLVLQEQSTRPLHDRDRFLASVGRLADFAAERPITLYQTWARKKGHAVYRSAWSGKSPDAMTGAVEEAYKKAQERLVAAEHGVSIAPVGLAWARAIARFPSVELFDSDGHHASAAGSHLAALVLASALTSGVAVAATRYVPEGITPPDAAKLRQAAGIV